MATKRGVDLVEWARPRVERNERYVLGAWVPKWDTKYRGPHDCAEFVSAGVFQTYGYAFGWAENDVTQVRCPEASDAYTGYWQRDARNGDLIVSRPNLVYNVPGAILLRVPSPKVGHIAICVGDGKHVYEAANRRLGVCMGEISGRVWHMGLKLPGVSYSTGGPRPPAPPMPEVISLTSPYTKGEVVKAIQVALITIGYPLVVDGVYGPATYAAVADYQNLHGLIPDGVVGPTTAGVLGLEGSGLYKSLTDQK